MEGQKKISLNTYIVTLIVVALIIIAIVLFFEKNNTSIEINNTSLSTTNTENFSIDIATIYSYVLKYNDLSFATVDDDGTQEYVDASFYKDTKVTYDTLSNEEKEIVVFNNIADEDITYVNVADIEDISLQHIDEYYDSGEQDIKVISSEVLNSTAKRIFGEQATDIQWDEVINCNVAEYIEYVDGNYYWYAIEGGGLGYMQKAEATITKIEKQGNYLYIYDKYLFADLTDYYQIRNGYVDYYTSSDKSEGLPDMSENDRAILELYEDNFEEAWSWVYNNYDERLRTYKHTFQIDDDGNYYWVSTEVAE